VSQRPVADGPSRWLDVELPSVAENLALDEALLAEAHDGLFTGLVVRTWMAREPVVVLGSSSHVSQEVDLAACEAEGVAVVRRPSGGLTVVVGPGCLMWTVVAMWPGPAPAIDSVHAAVLDPLAAALQWGKFANSTRPFTTWEPSDAAGMAQIAQAYSKGGAHARALRKAIDMRRTD
jgi:lipoate-protein ligase A